MREPQHDDVANEPTLPAIGEGSSAAVGELPAEIGGFRILGKLGEGGMGIVYEAEQQTPRRRVALKVVRGGHFVDEAYLRMFRRETETLARLVHPNIAAIYEAGRTDDGQHFFTMELVTGQPLGQFLEEEFGGKAPSRAQQRERLKLFVAICRAVNYAHQRGVIHRDLKPSNLVVTGAGEPKVLDFGLARITDQDVAAATVVSEVGMIKGTLPYMSPEQARGDSHEIDLRTDVYSLGVILYELLSGRQPYNTGGSIAHAVRAICEAPPGALRVTAAGAPIDADLRTITEKALEKEPGRRYESAAGLADDVERYLANQPILAHPPSTMYQMRKLASRHRGAFVATTAIAVLLAALAVTMVVQAQRVRRERDHAAAEGRKASAINAFLQDALGAADPWGKGSRDILLLDALRQARSKAEATLQGQPLVEAAVLQTIGTTLSNLAEFSEAEKALRASLDLRVEAAGPRSAEAAASFGALSGLYDAWRKFDESEVNAREAVAISRELYGASSLEAAAAIDFLSTALRRKGKLSEAKDLAEETLRIARAHGGAAGRPSAEGVDPGKVETDALRNLGSIALEANDPKAMEAIERELLALVRARHPHHRHPQVANTLNDLGSAQVLNGDFAAAEKSFEEALEMDTELLGEGHPEVASMRENLGGVYVRLGRLDETARILEEVLAARRKALGDDSEPVARTLANMAFVYMKAGNNEAAERTYREAVERLAQKLGPEHADVGLALACMGDVLRKEEKFAESEATLLRALDVLTKASGEDAGMSQWTLEALVNLYSAWGKPTNAAPYEGRLKP